MPADKKFHLDRNIPIAIILTIAVQTFGIMYAAGKLTQRVDTLEVAVTGQNVDSRRLDGQMQEISSRLVRIETLIETIRKRDK